MANPLISSPSLRDEPTWQTAAFTLPLIVFLVISSFAPDFTQSSGTAGAASAAARSYLVLVAIQILIAAGLIFYFRRIYTLHFSLKFSWLSVVVGVVGIIVWVGLAELKLEHKLLAAIGLESWLPNRPSFNPFAEFSDGGFRAIFLALRFTLLAGLVPIVEELFLRGWLVRWIENDDWQLVSLKQLAPRALAAATVYGVMTHPAEALAAIAWFSLVTWLMHRTGNLWDCVVAHAVTNFLLGVYVIYAEAWHLW